VEYAKDGLYMNAIAPGPTETPKVKASIWSKPWNESECNRRYSAKKVGTTEEVAELVTFLLTSKSAYINGEVIRIDGGFTNTK